MLRRMRAIRTASTDVSRRGLVEGEVVTVRISDSELASAVERGVEVLDEADLGVGRWLAGERSVGPAELALLEDAIELVDAIGGEPQGGGTGRSGQRAGADHDRRAAEGQAGPGDDAVVRVARGEVEAERG